MRVRAIERGYHQCIREEGEEFSYEGELGSWMERVDGADDAPDTTAPDSSAQPHAGAEAYHVGGGRWGVRDSEGKRIGEFTGSKDEASAEAERINAGTSDPDLTDQDNDLPDA